tara:strand:- start:491 stop:700 length:210 start_codon:yes stop_codon:yes gene_type:complete
MKYQVIAWSDACGSELVHETEDYNAARKWVVGFVRFDGLKHSNWEELLIQNRCGEPQATYDSYGWTHYR